MVRYRYIRKLSSTPLIKPEIQNRSFPNTNKWNILLANTNIHNYPNKNSPYSLFLISSIDVSWILLFFYNQNLQKCSGICIVQTHGAYLTPLVQNIADRWQLYCWTCSYIADTADEFIFNNSFASAVWPPIPLVKL